MINMPVKTVTETFHLSSYDSTNSITVGEVLDAETGPIGTSIAGYDYGAMYNEGKYSSIFRDKVYNAKNGLQSEWNIFYNFDLSNIPEDAIIKSVSCNVLGYYNVFGEMDRPPNDQKEIVSPIPRVTTLQLYNGIGKPKGNIRENCYIIDILTILDDSTAIEEKYKRIFSLDCGEWTREELKDCKLNMHVIRGADQNYIIDGVDHSGFAFDNFCIMMAADLTVEYEIQVPVNKVVFSGDTLIDLTSDTVCPEMLAEGITAHDMSGKKITGTMSTKTYVTKNLFTGSKEPSKNLGNDGDLYLKLPEVISKTFNLAAFDYANSKVYDTTGVNIPVGTILSDNINYYKSADYSGNNGKSSEWKIFYSFDLSELPDDAIIKSIKCQTRSLYWYIGDEYKPEIAQLQLYNGENIPKGHPIDCIECDDPKRIFNIECGEWTVEELKNCKLRLYALRNANTEYNNFYSPRIGGTDLTIEYISPSQKNISNTLLESFDYDNSTYLLPDNSSDNRAEKCLNKPYIYNSDYRHDISCFRIYFSDSITIRNHTLIYKFKDPSIPIDSIITNVKCIIKSFWTKGPYLTDEIEETEPQIVEVQLYNGNGIPKGECIKNRGSNKKIFEINGGKWTAEELNDCRLRLYYSVDGTSLSYKERYLWIYGANLIVEYKPYGSVSSSSIKVKTEGKWEDQVALETLENLLPNDTAYVKQ